MMTQFDRAEGRSNFNRRGSWRRYFPLALVLMVTVQIGAAQRPQVGLPSSSDKEPLRTPPAVSTKKLTKEGAPTIIDSVNTRREGDKLIIAISASGSAAHKEFRLSNPPRLVIDLLNVQSKIPFVTLPINVEKVKQMRVRQFQNQAPQIARLVFDLQSGNIKHEVLRDDTSIRVVFDLGSSAAAAPSAPVTPAPVVEPASPVTSKPAAQAAAPVSPKPAIEPAETVKPKPAAKPAELVTPKVAAQVAAPVSPKPAAKPAEPVTPKAATQAAANQRIAASRPPAVTARKLKTAQPAPQDEPTAPKLAEKVILPQPGTEAAAPILLASAAPSSIVVREPVRLAFQNTAGPDAGGDKYQGKPLTLDLVDINLVDFFRLMAEEGGINIVMDPGIKGTLSIKVVKVPWDQIFDAALNNNGLDKQIEGNLVRIARKATIQEEAKQLESLKKANLLAADVVTRVKRLNYTKAATIQKTLKEQQTVRGTVDIDERTNSLVLTDIPSSLDKVVALIETLDIPQPQVEIEARIVSATRNFARDIGIQFGFVQGNLQRVTLGGPNTFGTIGGSRPSQTPATAFVAGNPSTGRGAASDQTSRSGAVSTGSSGTGNYNVNLPSQTPFGGVGISVGNIFDTFLLDAAITAGETKGLAKLISQPKVTAQNNSAATITQGLRFPVQIVANNTITVQFQNAALTLTVTPQITYEGNVVLDLKVENNTPDFARSVNGIPSIRTSESNTRVLVSDGGTTVIGGILIDDETTQEDRVPGLASLPFIGNAFRRSTVSRSTQEVLFFVTPKIIK
jgi:type IV pilus assembly protein PilQ